MADKPLALRTGEDPALRTTRWIISMLAFVTILLSGADVAWLAASLAAFATVAWGCRLALLRQAEITRLLISSNGQAVIVGSDGAEQPVELRSDAWVSGRFCVVPVRRSGSDRVRRLIVCRSRQEPGVYRRLLQTLNLSPGNPHQVA